MRKAQNGHSFFIHCLIDSSSSTPLSFSLSHKHTHTHTRTHMHTHTHTHTRTYTHTEHEHRLRVRVRVRVSEWVFVWTYSGNALKCVKLNIFSLSFALSAHVNRVSLSFVLPFVKCARREYYDLSIWEEEKKMTFSKMVVNFEWRRDNVELFGDLNGRLLLTNTLEGLISTFLKVRILLCDKKQETHDIICFGICGYDYPLTVKFLLYNGCFGYSHVLFFSWTFQ